MILQRVVYELFDWEAEGYESNLASDRDELRRQIRLEGANLSRVFISWDWRKEDDPVYFLAYGGDSFFYDPPQAELDVSGAFGWKWLVDKNVEIGFQDESPQVVEVRSTDTVVCCFSFDCDRVFVMLNMPRPDWGERRKRLA